MYSNLYQQTSWQTWQDSFESFVLLKRNKKKHIHVSGTYRQKEKQILPNHAILACKVELHLHFVFDQLYHYNNDLKWFVVQKIDAKKCPMESFLIYFPKNSKYDKLLFLDFAIIFVFIPMMHVGPSAK